MMLHIDPRRILIPAKGDYMTTSTTVSPAASLPGTLTTEPAWLDQVQASAYLRTLGVTIAPKTLQKRRVIGGV